jgi:hypothetical protein
MLCVCVCVCLCVCARARDGIVLQGRLRRMRRASSRTRCSGATCSRAPRACERPPQQGPLLLLRRRHLSCRKGLDLDLERHQSRRFPLGAMAAVVVAAVAVAVAAAAVPEVVHRLRLPRMRRRRRRRQWRMILSGFRALGSPPLTGRCVGCARPLPGALVRI